MFPHQFLQVSRVFSTSTVTGFRRGGLYELQKSAPDLCQLYPRGRRNLEGNMEHQDVYTIACRTASSERGKTGKNPPLAGAPDVSSGPPFSLMLYKEHGPIQSHSMKKNTHTHIHIVTLRALCMSRHRRFQQFVHVFSRLRPLRPFVIPWPSWVKNQQKSYVERTP